MPAIEARSTSDKPLLPIYVSLYGVTDQRQIASSILCQAHPKLVGKVGRGVAGLGRAALKHYGLDNLFSEVPLKKVTKTFASGKQLIICFDDLERSGLEIKTAMGLINDYVEHVEAKVFILCDESQIPRQKSYKKIKEKAVRITCNYEIEPQSAVASITKRYGKQSAFAKMLIEHKTLIAEIFKRSGYRNLRILQYGLALLKKAYDADKKHIISTEQLLWTVLPASFDFHKGAIDSGDIDSVIMKGGVSAFSLGKKDEEKSAVEGFMDKYGFEILDSSKGVLQSRSLVSLIVDGHLNETKFLAEISALVEKSTPEFQALRSISHDHQKLNDKEFITALDTSLGQIESGVVSNWHDLTTLMRAIAHSMATGMTDKKADGIKAIFATGLETLVEKKTFRTVPSWRASQELTRFKDDHDLVKWIADEIIKVNDDVIQANNESQIGDIMSSLGTRFSDFVELINSNNDQSLAEVPLLGMIDPNEFSAAFIGLSNEGKQLVTFGIRSRYVDSLSNKLVVDLPWLTSAKTDLENWSAANEAARGPGQYWVRSLANVLSKAIEGIQAKTDAESGEIAG